VRLWPTLARFDLSYNPLRSAAQADWDAPHHRETLAP